MLKGCNIMARRKEFDPTKQEQALKLYEQATPSTSVRLKNGKIGIITDKFLSDEGIPHFWVQEIGAADPTPEPVEQVEATEELWIYRLKTKRDNHDPIAVVLFAGGGGVESGMLKVGIEPIVAVEFDPTKPELSKAIADTHKNNFPYCRIIRQTVQEVANQGFPGFPLAPDILWASPVCANFSVAKNGTEQPEDIEAASAVVAAIKKLSPKHFLLENVPAYQNSESWQEIYTHLNQLGYRVASSIVNMSDYGVPQARKRFIVRASRDSEPLPLPAKQKKISWHEAIEDLISELPDSKLLKSQQKAVSEFLKTNKPTPLLIDRTGGRGEYRAVESSQPSHTILRSHFTDGKGHNRNRYADIWLPDGTVKSLSIKCVQRLQTFPDYYSFPNATAIAGSILGYSVPPKFVELLLTPLTVTPESHSEPRQGESTYLNIAQIRRDGGTQPREKLDLNHITTLKEAIEDGAELEPVTLFYDGENYWLADGFHRCKASEESELEDIHCIIHQGTRRDAVLYSVGANAEHKAAKPRSRADKRRAVMMLLHDPEWSQWSNVKIAEVCKVNEKTVRNIRTKLTSDIRSDNQESKIRTYRTKHGTTATMQVGNIGKATTPESMAQGKTEKKDALTVDNNGDNTKVATPEQMAQAGITQPPTVTVNGKEKPPVTDYILGFLSNLDQMSNQQLEEVRSRIDAQLNQETDLNRTAQTVVDNAHLFTAQEIRAMVEALSCQLATSNGTTSQKKS